MRSGSAPFASHYGSFSTAISPRMAMGCDTSREIHTSHFRRQSEVHGVAHATVGRQVVIHTRRFPSLRGRETWGRILPRVITTCVRPCAAQPPQRGDWCAHHPGHGLSVHRLARILTPGSGTSPKAPPGSDERCAHDQPSATSTTAIHPSPRLGRRVRRESISPPPFTTSLRLSRDMASRADARAIALLSASIQGCGERRSCSRRTRQGPCAPLTAPAPAY